MNSFIEAMNSKFYLPDYLLVILDDDLIDYMQYKCMGMAQLIGPWIEYLADLFEEALQVRRDLLPQKAKNPEHTQVYWIEVVNHDNFDYQDRQAREVTVNA